MSYNHQLHITKDDNDNRNKGINGHGCRTNRRNTKTTKSPKSSLFEKIESDISSMPGTHYFYDYLMAIEKRLTHTRPTIDNFYGNVFVNLNGFNNEKQLNNERFTDITLRIHFIDTHNVNQFIDIQTHKVILAACSGYFYGVFNDNFCQYSNNNNIHEIHLNIVISDPLIIKEFFRLFYLPVFDDTQLSIQKLEYIVLNSILLHALSTRFLFNSLKSYCERIIYERLDNDLFNDLFKYCAGANPCNNSNINTSDNIDTIITRYVMHDKIDMFKRIISWFICCCSDIHSNHLTYINKLREDNDNDDTIIDDNDNINKMTNKPNYQLLNQKTNTPKEDYCILKRKRKQLSTSNNNKIEMFDYISSAVEYFDKYDLYSCFIKNIQDPVTNTIHNTLIRSFNRICPSCIDNNTTIQVCRMNQHISNNTIIRKWHFYLDLTTESKKYSTIYARVINKPKIDEGRQQQRIVSPPPRDINIFSCQTSITQLSKLFNNNPSTGNIPVISNLSQFTQLHQFYLHDTDCCYKGECDICHTHNTHIFIIKYDINVTLL